jgi:phosphoglucosamine mutase
MTAPKKIFGTDGVRGTANLEPVTAETALKLGRAAAHVFKNLERQSRGRGKHKIVIGKDTRLSGYMLENAISSGILSMGVDVLFIGPLPTPGVAYATRSLRADAGLVITASHNPYTDNGIKFFRADGYKLDDAIEGEIENLVFTGEIENVRPSADEIGKAVRIDDALGRYIEYAKASFPRGLTLEGVKIVLDCGHGAAYKSSPCVLRELGAETLVFNNQPDGKNINENCGSMHPEAMCRKVVECGAHLGIAGAGATVADVLAHRTREEMRDLRHDADLLGEPRERDAADVGAVDRDAPRARLVEARCERHDRALAAARRADKRDGLPARCGER